MKAKSILFAIVAIILLSDGCKPKESFDLKMTIEPQPGLYADKFFNFGETGNIIIKRLISLGVDTDKIDVKTFTDRLILTITKTDTSQTKLIEKLITLPGKIEFWETYENSELITSLIDANNRLKEMNVNTNVIVEEQAGEPVAVDTSLTESSGVTDLLEADTAGIASMKKFKAENPLLGVLIPRVNAEGQPLPSCLIGLAELKDTATVNRYLGMKEIKHVFPHDIRFYWSHNPYKYDKTNSLYELHAIKVTSLLGDAPISGDVIVSAKTITSKNSSDVKLDLSMNHEGAMKWEDITKENINRCIAIVIDGYVRSYPRVMNQITSGNTEITGDFSLTEAQYLAAILSSGANDLPLKLRVIESHITKSE
jgi:SecD/SecF fusion protein